MEQLEAYLRVNGIKAAAFAVELGVKPSTVTRILRMERKPGPDLARKISRKTGISLNDLRPDLWSAA